MYDNVSELAKECNEIEGRRRRGAWYGTLVFGALLAFSWAAGWPLVLAFIWLSGLLLGLNHGLQDRNAELAHLLANEIDDRGETKTIWWQGSPAEVAAAKARLSENPTRVGSGRDV